MHFASLGAGGAGTESDQAARDGDQAAALILRSNRNAQEVLDSGLLEVSDQNAALSKQGSQLRASGPWNAPHSR